MYRDMGLAAAQDPHRLGAEDEAVAGEDPEAGPQPRRHLLPQPLLVRVLPVVRGPAGPAHRERPPDRR